MVPRDKWSPRTVCSSNIWSPLVTDGPPQSACVSIARLFHEDSVKRLIQIKTHPEIELSLCSTGCHCYKLIKPAWMSFGVLIHNYFGNEESFSKQHRRQYLTARVVRVLERVCQAELTHQEEQETTAKQTAQAVVEDSSLVTCR